jgi:DNA polymerase III subunit delta'
MFDNIIGNDHLKESLSRLAAENRLPGSMIFAGPEGVGKRLFAIEVARSFVCWVSQGMPCGKCPACVRAGQIDLPDPDDKDDFKKVIFTNHPDVGMVAAAKRFILVDAIRDLENEAHFRPYEGAARTFIVNDADRMNDAASNALLKTLEEPAETSRIIVITSRPDSLLPTIRSRCQTLRFAPVPSSQIERFLVEKQAASRDEAALAARLARGSVGRAVAINAAQYTAQRERLLSVLRNAIERRDRIALLRISDELNDAKNKDRFEENLEVLETLIHDIWSISVTGTSRNIVNADVSDSLVRLAEEADNSDLTTWLGEIQAIRENLAVNINRKMNTDALFVKMAA